MALAFAVAGVCPTKASISLVSNANVCELRVRPISARSSETVKCSFDLGTLKHAPASFDKFRSFMAAFSKANFDVTKYCLAADGGDGGSKSGGGGGGDGGDDGKGDEGNSNPLLSALDAYDVAVKKNPLFIKSLTSLTGFAMGDTLAQNFLRDPDSTAGFDWARLARLSSFGFCVHGPTGHYFYNALDQAIPGTDAKSVISKVAIDQLGWAWIFSLMYFSYIGVLEGKSLDEIGAKIKADLFTSVSGSWKVWPVVHTINFRFVPSEWRILYINSVQIFYNIFLSWLVTRKVPSTDALEEEKKVEEKEAPAE